MTAGCLTLVTTHSGLKEREGTTILYQRGVRLSCSAITLYSWSEISLRMYFCLEFEPQGVTKASLKTNLCRRCTTRHKEIGT